MRHCFKVWLAATSLAEATGSAVTIQSAYQEMAVDQVLLSSWIVTRLVGCDWLAYAKIDYCLAQAR